MRSHSVAYRHKTAGDFLYLCGVEVIDAVLVIAGGKTYLLSEAFGKEASVWDDGYALTEADKKKLEGVHLENLGKLEEVLRAHLDDCDRIALPVGRNQKIDGILLSAVSYERRHRGRISNTPLAICDSRTLVGSLRQIKTAEEISLLKEAGARSSRVHTELMGQNFQGQSERSVVNWIESRFIEQGMQWTAYESIAGSGDRSTILHARGTAKILQAGEVLLVDAGGEWKGYCSDITRVLPVGKTFSVEQRAVYQIVLDAQKAVLSAVKPGESLRGLHDLALAVLSEGLLKEGFSKDYVSESLRHLMPHSTSHWIGLDVHDPSPYFDDSGSPLKLQEGMCFTVEPGIYFRKGLGAPAKYEGIGVRIEDDVVVTANGCDLLTSVPKEISEIESMRASL